MKNNIMGIVNRNADNTLLHNNANKDSKRVPVMRDMVAGEVAKHYALDEILPKHVAAAHIAGDIHYHDLDYAPLFPMFNCMLINIKGMLEKGFKMGNADIETPRSIATACAITAQIVAQVASHIYGGNTVDRIDEVLAPYVRKSYEKHFASGKLWCKDENRAVAYATHMTEKETYDAFQSLEYEINTMHTANGQTPFTTLGFGLGASWESRLIQKAILNVRRAGLGKHKRTAVFPKLVFTIKEGLNRKEGDVNYDIKQLAMLCASERMYPDVLNYHKTVEVTGGFKAPMGCRSFLANWRDENDELVYAGRNNLGVVSLNLPRLAIRADSEDEFFEMLGEQLKVCFDALMSRIDRLKGVTADVAPILYMEGACGVRLKAKDEVMQLFTDGRASISLGYIGLHEMMNAMFPDDAKHPFESQEKKRFGTLVMEVLKATINRWKKETGFGFSLYSTPSESLCDRFCRLDVAAFGDMAGVTDKGYYTNSFHLDVFKKVSPNDKIDFEAPYAHFASGGHITYCELPDMKRAIRALEWVWDYAYDKVPYFGTNTPVDYCGGCGFIGETIASEKGFECPVCGCHDPELLQVTRRVCGYLGAPNARPFIQGKQKEVIGRVKHQGD